MIKGHEKETAELKPSERAIAARIAHFIQNESRFCFVKSGELERRFKITGIRVRKIIHYIRVQGLIPFLVSTSNGYYSAAKSEDREVIEAFIESLRQRARSINEIADELTHRLNVTNNYETMDCLAGEQLTLF